MPAAGSRRRTPEPARLVAWEVLRAVREHDAYANLALPPLLARSGLPERDRALATELAYGALRAEGTLDHVLGLCSSRPLAEVDPALLDALRIGVYQLLRTRMPAHAAVATAVELAGSVAGEGPARFANAVLRKVAARHGDLGAPDPQADPVGYLAITTAHPRWVVEAFRDALDGDLDETARALAADDSRPEVHLVARPGRIDRAGLLAECAEAGLEGTPGSWSPYAVRLAGGDPARLGSVGRGDAAAQDEGSQLAALVLTRALAGVRQPRVLDLCAGPGGKSALVAAELEGEASLLAVDLHHHRALLTRQALGPADGALVARADGVRPAWRDGSMDAVLLDAPCSGLGALRRRPESRWRRQPEDVRRLVLLQRELLRAALRAVRPGGLVCYVVCSPHLAEGRGQLADPRLGGEPVDVRPWLPGVPHLGQGPWVQLWPHRHGTDAMFISAIRRPDGASAPRLGAMAAEAAREVR